MALTGCRVGTPACTRPDARPDARLDDLPVYLTGSDIDPWVPGQAVAQTFEAVNMAGA